MGKKINISKIKMALIVVLILYPSYVLIVGEVNQHKVSREFCKRQCTYYPSEKRWGIDLKWLFDEEGVESRINTEKYFAQKDLDECIDYCKNDLQAELKYLTQ